MSSRSCGQNLTVVNMNSSINQASRVWSPRPLFDSCSRRIHIIVFLPFVKTRLLFRRLCQISRSCWHLSFWYFYCFSMLTRSPNKVVALCDCCWCLGFLSWYSKLRLFRVFISRSSSPAISLLMTNNEHLSPSQIYRISVRNCLVLYRCTLRSQLCASVCSSSKCSRELYSQGASNRMSVR